MVQKINIGTSGWSYKHWKDDFYPKSLVQKNWLSFYSERFDITEINSSFYRLPNEGTVLKWKDSVPAKFLFCPKISRYLTHMKKLRDPEEPLQRFFDIFKLLKQELGPVLIQLPPMLLFHYGISDYFYKLLKKEYNEYEFVIEVRHQSWLSEDSMTLMAKYDIGLVISQSGHRFPYTEMITAKNIYLRFHGPAAHYASSYTDEDLKYFAVKFKNWSKEGHVIWAFFNNDIHGFAPRDAFRLKALCKE